MDFLARLKKLKEERGLTTNEIAELSNIPAATISRVLSGQTANPTFETITAITIALGGSLDEIAGIKSPEERMQSPRIENVITNYADLLKSKDDLITEKNDRIAEKTEAIEGLRKQRDKERKEKHWLAFFTATIILIVIGILIFDLANGHIGYFRY